jgi:type II secretory pathway pseudopilin PulG
MNRGLLPRIRLARRITVALAQAGDTIVEVLICIAIISFILGGAFVVVDHSRQGVRDAQEHGDALKLTESQLEQLRADVAAGGANADVFTQTPPFCMFNSAAVSTVITPTNAECTQAANGTPTTQQPEYQLSIERAGPDAHGGYLFTVSTSWDDINGGQANESMVYRLYK